VRAAVLGATGFVGRALVPALAKRGEVVAVSRRPTAPELPGVRSIAADLTDRKSARGALEGVDVAYHLVHSLGARNFSELDRRVAENVVTEAQRASVTQIVHLGGLGDDASDLSPHLRSSTETGAVLSSTTVPLTTLRAAVVVGPRATPVWLVLFVEWGRDDHRPQGARARGHQRESRLPRALPAGGQRSSILEPTEAASPATSSSQVGRPARGHPRERAGHCGW
jgi:hypothetical protein